MLSRLPETYLLNASQALHLVVLAGFVPWYVGMESYGEFAALIAVPGLIQSSFEAYAIAFLSGNGDRRNLRKAISFVLIPSAIILFIGYAGFIGISVGFVTAVVASTLYYRSYGFAVAISTGRMTSQLMRSDALILCIYLGVLFVCVALGVRDYLLPSAMVCGASFISGWYLLRGADALCSRYDDVEKQEPLPKKLALRAASARLYEDGFLSLSPLILAAATSSAAAGQFRVFVSAIKAIYKLFPVRYEIAMRDLVRGCLRLSLISKASWSFSVVSVVAAVAGYALLDVSAYGWILVLTGSAGAAVASLALYPAVCSVDKVVTVLCVFLMAFTFGLAFLWGVLGFSIGFACASYIVMFRSFRVLRAWA